MPDMQSQTHGSDCNDGSAGLDIAVVAEQVRLLNRKRTDLPVNLVNAAIVTVVMWGLYPAWLLLSWLGVFYLVILARVIIRLRYRTIGPGPERARYWARIFTFNAFLTACLWGLTGSVILVTSDPVRHVFIVFVLGGMVAGSAVTNSAYMPTMVAFTLPAILPAVVALVVRLDMIQGVMAGMLAAFVAVLLSAGWNINRSIVENLRLRIGQEFLLTGLKASEAGMAEAQAAAHGGSWVFDVRTSKITWSHEAFLICGFDPATFKPSYDALIARVHPLDRAAFGERRARFLTDGTGNAIDHRIVLDDGTIRHLHEITQANIGSDGEVTTLSGTMQDITEWRRTQDALEFANGLLKAEMEASLDGILVVDPGRTIISFNQNFVDIWKKPAGDLIEGKTSPPCRPGQGLSGTRRDSSRASIISMLTRRKAAMTNSKWPTAGSSIATRSR